MRVKVWRTESLMQHRIGKSSVYSLKGEKVMLTFKSVFITVLTLN